MNAATDLVGRFTTYIIDPAILLVFAAGFFLFTWGLVQFLGALGDNESGTRREAGKRHIVWGLVGMLVMISVYGIIALLDNTFNLRTFQGPDMNRLNNINTSANFFGR